ncbi:MAG: hypothetical protein KDC98_09070 [Planctomycetes bacterium]|nr:hypothetical protein [Planctomycetota bacterium]
MNSSRQPAATVLRLEAGELRIRGWPPAMKVPFGMRCLGNELRGPARLRARVRFQLRSAGATVVDGMRPIEVTGLGPAAPAASSGIVATARSALQRGGWQGLVAGLAESAAVDLVLDVIAARRRAALVLVADSAAEQRWLQATAAWPAGDLVVRTVGRASRDMHWLGARHDIVVVDHPELMLQPQLEQTLDAAAAAVRIGLPARVDPHEALHWSRWLGPLVAAYERAASPRCCELRVPMPAAVAEVYGRAFHTFLAAFDRFAAASPQAGFGTFVQQARRDPLQRPALRAWHAALRTAAWHSNKAQLIAELLRLHRRDRVLVFTPDRLTAYELAREFLIAPITSEIPRRERGELLAAFAGGTLRALVGPRLLDLGVAECSADVAILVGGGFGRDQRAARCRRVRADGVVYELVSIDTVEVGRAQRWRGTAAAPSVGVLGG